MKSINIKYIILSFFVAGIFFTSCDELETDTMGVVSSETYYSDELTLDPAIIGIYANLHRATWALDQLAPYYGADDLTSRLGSNKAPVLEADLFNRTAGNSWVTNTYNYYYKTILSCNDFIEQASKQTEIEEAVLNNALANAYFVRGMLWFRLATSFQDVPMPLSPISDLEMTRTDYRTVMEQSISDLEYAEQWAVNDRDVDPSIANGYATVTAAKALLAKTYMQLTGYPSNETDKWANVKSLCKEIIDAGAYELVDDFAAPFQRPTKNNKETIFAHKCEKGSWPTSVQCRYYGFKWGNWADCFMEHKYYENFPEGYRKYYSAFGDDELAMGDTYAEPAVYAYFDGLVESFKHPFVAKFWYGTIGGIDWAPKEHNWQTSNDIPVIRTAEVYLMYAEACARSGEYTEAATYLNYVKRRAYAQNAQSRDEVLALETGFWKNDEPAVDYSGEMTESALIDAIVFERAYEFLGETGGNRWLDLLRLGLIEEANADRNSDSREISLTGSPSDESQWWTPIPDTEFDLNPNL